MAWNVPLASSVQMSWPFSLTAVLQLLTGSAWEAKKSLTEDKTSSATNETLVCYQRYAHSKSIS